MMIRASIRCYSTRTFVDKLFSIIQSSSEHDKRIRLEQLMKRCLQKENMVFSNFINDVIHRWAIEQPKKEALRMCNTDNDQSKKLTFSDISEQSSRLANVLTGKEYNLEAGKTVLGMLPYSTPERLLLQLACSQSGLVFSHCDPKDLTNVGICQRIQNLAIDCIITNEDNLEIARRYTHNPLRPLKKGLITKCSTSEPLPVGWNHLMRSANDAESEFTKKSDIYSKTPVLRLLSNKNEVIQYSQEDFNLQLVIAALWLNVNRTSQLIWMKNSNEIISVAPWIFGSSIFLKETENLQTTLSTFAKHPIDTFCASSAGYEMLGNQQRENKTHLAQLFSTESVDPMTKTRWHSMTNLHIRDDYDEFNQQQSRPSSVPDNTEQKMFHDIVRYHLGEPISSIEFH